MILRNPNTKKDIPKKDVVSSHGSIKPVQEKLDVNVLCEAINKSTAIGGIQVFVTKDKLGIFSSAERFKHDIEPMKDTSFIYNLKPRNFKYNEDIDPGQIEQYGLISEEVEQVLGAEFLVVYDGDVNNYPPNGRTMSVRYHDLPILILNELIKTRALLESQRVSYESRLDAIEALIMKQ